MPTVPVITAALHSDNPHLAFGLAILAVLLACILGFAIIVAGEAAARAIAERREDRRIARPLAGGRGTRR